MFVLLTSQGWAQQFGARRTACRRDRSSAMVAAVSCTKLLPDTMSPSVLNATSATALSPSNAATKLTMPPAHNQNITVFTPLGCKHVEMAHFTAVDCYIVTCRVCLSLTERLSTVYNQLCIFTGESAHVVKELLVTTACVVPRCKISEVTCWEVCSHPPDSSHANIWQHVSATFGLPFRR